MNGFDKYNNNQNNNNTNDDYLDELMKDLMNTQVDEQTELTKHTNSISNDESGDEKEEIKDKVVNKGPTQSTRRKPLFQSLGIANDENNNIDNEGKDSVEYTPNEINKPILNESKKGEQGFTEQARDVKDDTNIGSSEGENGVDDKVYYVDPGEQVGLVDPSEQVDSVDKVDSVHLDGKMMDSEVESVGKEDNFGDDLFDNMLEDLTGVIDIGTENDVKEDIEEKESDVIVPLEKPGMRDIKVTPDGRTLAEMLPGMRSGNRTVKDKVKDIIEGNTVIEVDGKKFSDDRYLKHVEVIDKEREEQEKKIALSRKFLQRNAEFTEEEKIIMNNLGLNNEQLSSIMKSQELSRKQKEALIGLGRYGAEKYFKGRKYKTTVGDQALLEFLIKFKFANTRILRWVSNEPQGRTWRKLNRLRNSGLVESKTIIGIPDLWGATPSGVGVAGYPYQPGLRPMPKMLTISASLGINYIAACLWFNTINVLNLLDFPASNRPIALQEDGVDRVRGEDLVSELEIRSSLGKEINPHSTTMKTLGDERLYDVIASNVRGEFEKWVSGGKVSTSPEFQLGNEYMWVLYPTSQLTLSYHVPDLVVRRERGPNGEPKSIAVEMERYDKSSDRYDKIMLAYKLDEYLYEKVIWITPNTRVARALEAAAKQVGFDRYSIIPIITETGTYDKPDIWLI